MNTVSHWRSEDQSLELESSFTGHNIPAKSLNIVWGKDPRYWGWIPLPPEAKLDDLQEAAVLHQVNWLEVAGNMRVASSAPTPITCKLYYLIKFRVDAFGWDSVPIKFKINVGGHETERREYLELYTAKNDKWHEIDGGEFTVPPFQAVSLSFCMLENGSEWWKGGMILGGVKIKPKIDGEKVGKK